MTNKLKKKEQQIKKNICIYKTDMNAYEVT